MVGQSRELKPRGLRLWWLLALVAASAFLFASIRWLNSRFGLVLCMILPILAVLIPRSFTSIRSHERAALSCCGVLVVSNFVWAVLWMRPGYGQANGVMYALACGCLGLVLWFDWFLDAWSSARSGARVPMLALPIVLGLVILPFTIFATQWPLRLAFSISRPMLDSLADQVEAGLPVKGPVRAGLFEIRRMEVDLATSNSALILDDNPGGRTGLVRLGPTSSKPLGPLFNLNLNLRLDRRWRFQEED